MERPRVDTTRVRLGGSESRLLKLARKNLVLVVLGLLLVAVLYLANSRKTAGIGTTDRTVILGAKLIDGTGKAAIEDSIIVIKGNLIEMAARRGELPVPRGARVIDATGRTALPGLIDCDVHLVSGSAGTATSVSEFLPARVLRDLKATLYWGTTTLRDGGDSFNYSVRYRDGQNPDNIVFPRLYASGPWLTARGGFPALFLPPIVASDVTRQIGDPSMVQGTLDEVAEKGVDMLEIAYDGGSDWKPYPRLSVESLRQMIELAHAKNLRVSVVTRSNQELKEALHAGAMNVEHISAEPIDETCLALLLSKGAYYCPSLTVRYADMAAPGQIDAELKDTDVQGTVGGDIVASIAQHKGYFFDLKKDSTLVEYLKDVWANSQTSLKLVSDRGVKVVVGTGAGSPAVFHGIAPHEELRLMVAAGMSRMQAIVAATQAAAGFIGVGKQLGTIEAGKQADILLVDGDPLEDIGATRKVWLLFKNGNEIDRARLLAR